MGRTKKVQLNSDAPVEIPLEASAPDEKKVSEQPVPEPVEEQVERATSGAAKYPEVAGTGKFAAVAVRGGYVVYNPAGQRVTDIVPMDVANDFVRDQNRAAQL